MELEVKGVSKSFKNKKVIDNVSFSLREPGIFGLLGSNGAGKTTMIRMILRYIKNRFRNN